MKPNIFAGQMVEALVGATGAQDAIGAIRLKAAKAVILFCEQLGEPEFPLNIEVLASLLGISISEEPPAHSRDAELVPRADGRVEIRISEDTPETRRRFSLGHEISHTFFPGYEKKTWCRTDARYRRSDNPDDLIEMLCDVGASHLLMPEPWFEAAAARVRAAADLVELAGKFGVSREAALRRYVEGNPSCCAAVYFSWKLKPTQRRTLGQEDQLWLFGDRDEVVLHAKKLRVDYSVPSKSFAAMNRFIPCDKSVTLHSPLYKAASSNVPAEGECYLDLGLSAAGRYRILALPVWTADQERGPNGESGVAAILEFIVPAT